MSQDRRNFMKNVGTGAAAAAAVAKLSETTAPAQNTIAILNPTRVSPNNQIKLALELDGEFAGWLSSVEGGDAVGSVVEYQNDDNGFVKKTIGNVKYEDISITCGFEMGKAFYDWISSSLKRDYKRKNGSIVAADYDYNAKSVRSFANALISELTIPAADAGSKDASKLTLKFAPEFSEYKHTTGRLVIDENKYKQEFNFVSDFKFVIDGLDKASGRVSKVEAITIKQSFSEYREGGGKFSVKVPGKLEFPNLKITLPEIAADEFAAWHEDFVVKGESTEDKHKTGSLVFLNRNRQKELLTLSFSGLGIFKYAPEALTDANKYSVPQVKAEVYCEEISFKFGPVLE